MDIDRNTRMQVLLSDEDVRSVLQWYGLPTNDRRSLRLSLADFCDLHDVDVDDILAELGVEEPVYHDEDGWLFV